MKTKPIVYSYLRFSDPKQAAGSSADRQIEYAKRWASEHGMTLDSTLSLRDEGLSAYHQRHVKQGALGVFLRAVEDGHIPAGSVLIVEGLDRLSRAEPIQAQAQLAQIVNSGITVVTASDGREYNRESLKRQPMDLVYSLLVMIRAHEESDTKSKRVKAAIRRQCQNWLAGTWKGQIRNGKDPQWVHSEDGQFRLVPERVSAIRLGISLFKEGHGAVTIMRHLTANGLKLTIKGNGASQFYKTIHNRALIGEKSLEVDGETFRLPGYYPAMLSDDEFLELQQLAATRGLRKGRGEIAGFVTGLKITYCGYCGQAMVAQNLMGRNRRPDGTPQHGHRRMICVGNSHNQGCSVPGSCSIVPVERAVMNFCADQMNLSRLAEGGSRETEIVARLARARARAADLSQQLERITAAILDGEGVAPASFRRKATELESEEVMAQADIASLERELASISRGPTTATAKAWRALMAGVEALDNEARMKARQLVADTFSRIVVFHRGVTPGPVGAKTGVIDLLLVGKHGNTRMLHIDRQTGEWKAGEDLHLPSRAAGEVPLPPGL
ncbi:recombinase family protein [Achromobacter sp. Root565]|uniref:recombinase family protein n=1 Tax=Achromobacter sp. Root565 TaxID=1736564 RepID=UPI0006FB3BB1|nr:recombinase family protein [Achromobacter sp. Root565]KRA01309.1 integrase [Achromobacter sp. Root565]